MPFEEAIAWLESLYNVGGALNSKRIECRMQTCFSVQSMRLHGSLRDGSDVLNDLKAITQACGKVK